METCRRRIWECCNANRRSHPCQETQLSSARSNIYFMIALISFLTKWLLFIILYIFTCYLLQFYFQNDRNKSTVPKLNTTINFTYDIKPDTKLPAACKVIRLICYDIQVSPAWASMIVFGETPVRRCVIFMWSYSRSAASGCGANAIVSLHFF